MALIVTAAALAAAFALTADKPASPAPPNGSVQFQPSPALQPSPVEQDARDWLALIDAGDAQASRAAAAPEFRQQYSMELWELGVLLRLNNHGTPLARQLVEERIAGDAHGQGNLVTIVFATDFTREAGASERMTMHRGDDGWRVTQYDVIRAEDSCAP